MLFYSKTDEEYFFIIYYRSQMPMEYLEDIISRSKLMMGYCMGIHGSSLKYGGGVTVVKISAGRLIGP